jgi:hypothetical protein
VPAAGKERRKIIDEGRWATDPWAMEIGGNSDFHRPTAMGNGVGTFTPSLSVSAAMAANVSRRWRSIRRRSRK